MCARWQGRRLLHGLGRRHPCLLPPCHSRHAICASSAAAAAACLNVASIPIPCSCPTCQGTTFSRLWRRCAPCPRAASTTLSSTLNGGPLFPVTWCRRWSRQSCVGDSRAGCCSARQLPALTRACHSAHPNRIASPCCRMLAGPPFVCSLRSKWMCWFPFTCWQVRDVGRHHSTRSGRDAPPRGEAAGRVGCGGRGGGPACTHAFSALNRAAIHTRLSQLFRCLINYTLTGGGPLHAPHPARHAQEPRAGEHPVHALLR